jgi:hypothetical protein
MNIRFQMPYLSRLLAKRKELAEFQNELDTTIPPRASGRLSNAGGSGVPVTVSFHTLSPAKDSRSAQN